MPAETPPNGDLPGAPGSPPVSIGLPVYNGGARLRDVLDRILSQSHAGFELIVGDNASEDSTRDICLEYAARDPRIRYHRHPENIGPARNFSHVLRLARGKYFIWTAHDDQWLPGHLESLVRRLEANPSAVLAINGWEGLDGDDRIIPIRIPAASLAAADRREAFRRYLTAPYFEVSKACFVYGLIRRETLAALPVEDIFGEMHNIGADRPIGRDVLLVLTLLSRGLLEYSPSPATWRYRYKGPRKYRTVLKKTYDLLRFPLEGLLGRRKSAWKNIREFHRTADGIISRHFDGDPSLRAANLYNTIRLCSLFK